MPEEPLLERLQELVALERADALVEHPVLLEDTHVVLERRVRGLQAVVELEALEHVVVGPRRIAGAVLGVDRTAHGPDGARLPLDPEDDMLVDPGVVDAAQDTLGETPRGVELLHERNIIAPVGRLADVFRNPFSFLFQRSSQEERLAAYVIREHERGRSLEEILDDRYLVNRTTPAQRARLLDRPEVIRAIGDETIASARATIASPT
jgi:hypothetical protein